MAAPRHSSNFESIDGEKVFKRFFSKISSGETQNFTVEFDEGDATCAINLDVGKITTLIGRDEAGGRRKCRWFNFWGWTSDHQSAIAVIASKYDVSPRLRHLLCPLKAADSESSITQPQQEPSDQQTNCLYENSSHLEKAASSTSDDSIPIALDPTRSQSKQLTSISDVADDLWHFCSVDWGPRYLCVGFNGLFTTREGLKSAPPSKPRATRIWSAVLLCEDGTVLSVFESPKGLSAQSLQIIRKNQLNIFQHLSRTHSHSSQNALMQVNIRGNRPGMIYSGDNHLDVLNTASLLFYYLFDDWTTAYGLISGREHPYRERLENLRQKMMQSAEVGDVETLHQIGRQLTVLRSVYKSYEIIADRILHRQGSLMRMFEARYHHQPDVSHSDRFKTDFGSIARNEVEARAATVRLSPAATDRFERLLDRIRLYALAEIEQSLAEKEQLVWMNFNLVTLKESAAIEKLTRTTILLAKATILFLPVSLLTAYFSTQFHEIDTLYSLKTYWLSFLVVAVLSIAFLFGFGLISHKVQGKTVFRSLTMTLLDKRRKGKTQKTV